MRYILKPIALFERGFWDEGLYLMGAENAIVNLTLH